MSKITAAFNQIYDIDGKPITGGDVYIGVADQDPQISPISVFADADLTIPLSQPLDTRDGYILNGGSFVNAYVAEAEYSIRVINKNGTVALYNPKVVGESLVPVTTVSVADYAALRALNPAVIANGTVINVTNSGIAGSFVLVKQVAHGQTDNGGTIIVINADAYARRNDENLYGSWFQLVGDGITDDYANFLKLLNYSVSSGKVITLVNGTYLLGTNTIINTTIEMLNNAKIKPANGIVVTLNESALIKSDTDYKDTTAGGSFTNNSGSWEFRIPTRVSSPTGGRTVHIGFPGNIIDESSGACFVFGGAFNQEHSLGANSELSVIGGAYDNTIGNLCSASTIAGGAHHIITDNASHSSILGGSYQTSNASYATLVGGQYNTAHSSWSVICGGQLNIVGDSLQPPLDTRSAFIGGGTSNTSSGLRSVVVGGFTNVASNEAAFIGAGTSNTASGSKSIVIGGASNTASGLACISGGESCSATNSYSIALGEFILSEGVYSFATGSRSKASLRGQRAHASGYFTTRGDAQTSTLVARRITTGATPLNMDLFGGTSAPIVIPDNTNWFFEITLIARRTDASDDAAYTFTGVLKRNSGVATTAILGSVTKTVVYESDASWDANVTADTVNGALKIEVTGAAAKTIRWVATIQLTEVAQ